jgi:hypothetical protein
LQSQVQSGTAKFEYFFGSATPIVPEPSSWAMMIAGFAIVGCSLRRRERYTQLEA